MKKILFAVALASLLEPCVRAQNADTNQVPNEMPPVSMFHYVQRFGIGMVFGEPTGPDAKYWLNDTWAVDGALGWSSYRRADAEVHADILWHDFDLIPVSRGELPVYVGVGLMGRFRHHADNQSGVRIPIGISYMFDSCPVDIFAEIAPVIIFAPTAEGNITGGIGARYWF